MHDFESIYRQVIFIALFENPTGNFRGDAKLPKEMRVVAKKFPVKNEKISIKRTEFISSNK